MSPEQIAQSSAKLTSLHRLRRIDQLREHNIGSYLPLPQLVAVGDQSSGKSSLLESLCGIPFPRGQELCTRYATQITHHREESQRIDISVIPGPNATPGHKENLRSYTRQLHTTEQLRNEFKDILAQVDSLMNINTASNAAGENTFSEDVLKIEKHGPDEDLLTIIDVPGIFRNTTEGVTTNRDKELVKSMVKRYIKDSRTVILAVLPSNVDVATQEILTLARRSALVRAALEADYSAHQAFARDDLRLITTVVNLTDKFNSDFGDFGCTYMFEWQLDISNLFAATVAQPPTSGFATDGEGEENSDDGSNATELTSCDIPDPTMYPDLEGIIVTDWHIEPPKQGIMKWIETVHHRSRGLDLGSVTPRILSSVFREQSAKWELISRQYLSKVILLLHRFILSALQVVCADSQVVQNILSMTIGDICAKYEASMAQVELLAGVERQQRPYTLNVSFNENQQKSQGVRIKNTLLPKARRENGKSLSPRIINLSDVPEAFTNKSNAAYARETVHDSLEAYYKVAYRRFVDNVFSQAVDYKLLSGPDTPLRLLSDGWVLKLNTEELQFIAGESRWTRERRKKLTKEIDDLEVAMKILR
ncbi:hypothetical protein COL940_010625 [Colletotrichum noveboracense]|nr:hypothetical protein COL940_010625 [Colletotrichum noveboracense]KAJ0278029.1 hypothetical protein CBS470a_009999 [Colletotrichum nupharicola]